MPVFLAKPRTAEAYLAGIGASGALMASAFVMFVILVGVVTFDAWPRTILTGADGEAGINTGATPAAAAQPTTPTVVKLRHKHSAAPIRHGDGRAASGPPRSEGSLVPDTGNTGGSPGGSTGGQPVEAPQPPSSVLPPASGVVNRTVSTVGNTVEATTTTVGDTLGGNSSPGIGGVVGDLGRTVNGTVQGLAGNR